MNELYWINFLGKLEGVLCTTAMSLIIFSLAFLFFAGIGMLSADEENESDVRFVRKFKKHFKKFITILIVGFILLFLTMFVPSKKEAYIIFGVGSTIDYIQENKTLKELPNKYIKILDKFADDYLNQPNKNK